MKRLLLFVLAAALAGCASSADSPSREEAPASRTPDPGRGLVRPANEPVEIYIDTGDRDLGAYDLTLVYDRTLVRVLSVEPTAEFAPPQYVRSGLTSGELKLAAYQLEKNPRGRVVVARVTFESFGGPASRLSVRLRTLADSNALPMKGRAEASRDRVP
jgi:hypothetical protein